MVNLKVKLCDIALDNPVIPASGTFGYGSEYAELYDINCLGSFSFKGTTLEPRFGNPTPRIAECPDGMINAVGLQNPGVESFFKYVLPQLKKIDTNIIVNISGNTMEEYCEMADIISDSGCHIIEMNVSCPNVKQGGVAFGTNPDTIYEITNKVKKHCKIPLVVKLSPNVTDIAEMAKAAEAGGADGLSLINTLLGMSIDIHKRRPILRNNVGGLSGPCVKPIAVRMVWQVKNAVEIPLIGMGGISTGEDAVEFMLAGASLVSVGTANFVNPYAARDTVEGIEKYLDKYDIEDINYIIGKVEAWN